jgi:hypothetical protein
MDVYPTAPRDEDTPANLNFRIEVGFKEDCMSTMISLLHALVTLHKPMQIDFEFSPEGFHINGISPTLSMSPRVSWPHDSTCFTKYVYQLPDVGLYDSVHRFHVADCANACAFLKKDKWKKAMSFVIDNPNPDCTYLRSSDASGETLYPLTFIEMAQDRVIAPIYPDDFAVGFVVSIENIKSFVNASKGGNDCILLRLFPDQKMLLIYTLPNETNSHSCIKVCKATMSVKRSEWNAYQRRPNDKLFARIKETQTTVWIEKDDMTNVLPLEKTPTYIDQPAYYLEAFTPKVLEKTLRLFSSLDQGYVQLLFTRGQPLCMEAMTSVGGLQATVIVSAKTLTVETPLELDNSDLSHIDFTPVINESLQTFLHEDVNSPAKPEIQVAPEPSQDVVTSVKKKRGRPPKNAQKTSAPFKKRKNA